MAGPGVFLVKLLGAAWMARKRWCVAACIYRSRYASALTAGWKHWHDGSRLHGGTLVCVLIAWFFFNATHACIRRT